MSVRMLKDKVCIQHPKQINFTLWKQSMTILQDSTRDRCVFLITIKYFVISENNALSPRKS
jgi:hypothetical protein